MGTHQRSHTALKHRLDALDLRRQLPRIRQRLTKASEAINRTYANRQLEQRAALDTSVAKLESLSPLGVLARGYSVCWNEKRTTILRSANEVAVGDNVKVKLHEGELSCQVKEG
jgi:exodeoxyribonuclease VII large subunit